MGSTGIFKIDANGEDSEDNSYDDSSDRMMILILLTSPTDEEVFYV